MGRKKKYLTKEEKHQAQLKWMMEYYERNKKLLQEKALARYYKIKGVKNEK